MGTHLGTFQGIPPTGWRVTYNGIDLNQVIKGRVVESWHNYDTPAPLQEIDRVRIQDPSQNSHD